VKHKFMLFSFVTVVLSMIVFIALLIHLETWPQGSLPLKKEQIAYLQQWANDGDAEACWCLQAFYLKDAERHKYWIAKGAALGDPKAQYQFFVEYENSGNIDERRQAVEQLKKAAEQEYKTSELELARQYRDGIIIKRNSELAIAWYLKAVKKGDRDAMLELSELYTKVGRSESFLLNAYKWLLIHELLFPEDKQFPAEIGNRINVREKIKKTAIKYGINLEWLQSQALKLAEKDKAVIPKLKVDDEDVQCKYFVKGTTRDRLTIRVAKEKSAVEINK
jgi:TPR repeat protein